MHRNKTIEDMHRLAGEHGGKCLSKAYENHKAKLRWQCSEGHQWQATPSAVQQGSWCHLCARSTGIRATMVDMHKLAARHGGKCLSLKYTNARTKLLWQCREGHQWQTTPTKIQTGHWCPICKQKKLLSQKLRSLERDFQKL